MAAKRNPFHRIRLVYRRSSTLLKCVVLATILLSTAALVILRTSIQAEKSQQAQLQEQAAQLEQENQELQEDIDSLGTAGSVVEIAQKLWDLVFPDTVVIEPEE